MLCFKFEGSLVLEGDSCDAEPTEHVLRETLSTSKAGGDPII